MAVTMPAGLSQTVIGTGHRSHGTRVPTHRLAKSGCSCSGDTPRAHHRPRREVGSTNDPSPPWVPVPVRRAGSAPKLGRENPENSVVTDRDDIDTDLPDLDREDDPRGCALLYVAVIWFVLLVTVLLGVLWAVIR